MFRVSAGENNSMTILRTAREIRELVDDWHQSGFTVALVPTMGALHEGHLSLVSLASSKADRVVVSIFVNPTQFGPKEDFLEYPRDVADDISKLDRCDVDAVFLPAEDVMYPTGFATAVSVSGAADTLCGKFRPHFFGGVATVCAVLFGVVKPDIAVFGRKDAQQLAVIKRMVKDLRLGVEIAGGSIIREDDGLAMSSRNRYLNPGERKKACGICKGLRLAAREYRSGVTDPEVLKQLAREEFERHKLHEVQYLEIVDVDTMQPVTEVDERALMCTAVYVGGTRLIDNIILNRTIEEEGLD